MEPQKNWRDAKPKWVVEAAESELKTIRLQAALSWPCEAEPKPVPFSFGAYDSEEGTVKEGTYWQMTSAGTSEVQIKKMDRSVCTDGGNWKIFMFMTNGIRWTAQTVRGPLYASKRDAQLSFLWNQCREYANSLERTRAVIGL